MIYTGMIVILLDFSFLRYSIHPTDPQALYIFVKKSAGYNVLKNKQKYAWIIHNFHHNTSWVTTNIGTSCRRSSRSPFRRLNDRGPLFSLFFSPLFHFSVTTFSQRRIARIKKHIYRKLMGVPKNLGVHPFPDPVGNFSAAADMLPSSTSSTIFYDIWE